MTLKFIHQNYLKYNKGKGFICGHVDALHATPPSADVYTDIIAEKVITKTGCAGIISTVSRNQADLNRNPDGDNDQALIEYRHAIKEILEFLDILGSDKAQITKPYLHLSFHGMKDHHYGPYGIEVGTVYGQSCSPEVGNWFKEILIKKTNIALPEIKVVFNEKFSGDDSIVYHRLGDGKKYKGYGPHFHTFQIELSRTIRSKHRKQIMDVFSEIMLDFQTEFVDNIF